METKNIQQKIEAIETQMFYMEMANFINWTEYNKLQKEIQELKKLVQ
jgi:hypothetical protein